MKKKIGFGLNSSEQTEKRYATKREEKEGWAAYKKKVKLNKELSSKKSVSTIGLYGKKDPWASKVKLTPAQKKAWEAYRFAEKQEDRYLGSVFVNAHGQKQYEDKTRAAYEACKRLGMGVEHGM